MNETTIDINRLYHLYVIEKKSGRECAKILNRGKSSVLRQIKKHGWSRPNMQRRDEFSRFIKNGQELPEPFLHNAPTFKSGITKYRKIAEIYRIPKFCFHCNKTENLHIHHIDENRENNDPSNLRWVCGRCHNTIEHADRYNNRDEYGRFI